MTPSLPDAETAPAATVTEAAVPEAGVSVRVWDLDRPGWSLEECRAVLDGDERAVAERLRAGPLRDRFVVRRACVRHLLGGRTGLDPANLRLTRTPTGKPVLSPPWDDVAFNVSHSRNLCSMAIGAGAAIGIDIEHVEATEISAGLADLVLRPAEQARLARRPGRVRAQQFYRAWTRKEAMLKAIGLGLGVSPTSVTVDLTADWRVALWFAESGCPESGPLESGPLEPESGSPDPRRCSWVDLSDRRRGYCLALMVFAHE